MEDITKYIGLLGFVPVILLLLWGIFTEDGRDVGGFLLAGIVMGIIFLGLVIAFFGGFIWGITTLGRLL